MENTNSFLVDVVSGLTSSPKSLPSKYFYDEMGDKLFHYIMNQPEYYLTCAEHEILGKQGEAIFSNIKINKRIRLIEPGAGDGFKTRLLVHALMAKGYECTYNPIDISANVLDILCTSMLKTYPQLECEPIIGDYAELSEKIPDDGLPRLMLFLGSSLGNYDSEASINILRIFSTLLKPGDFFLLGVDLVKEPSRILAAYNDASGYTAQFNYNLLTRINRELDANFDTDNFLHFPVYNPILQQAESYLLSKQVQLVTIKSANVDIHFGAWEPIHTEISRKYTLDKIESLSTNSGFQIISNYTDMHNDFCCSLWQKR